MVFWESWSSQGTCICSLNKQGNVRLHGCPGEESCWQIRAFDRSPYAVSSEL